MVKQSAWSGDRRTTANREPFLWHNTCSQPWLHVSFGRLEAATTARRMKFSEIINDQQLATEAVRRWTTTAICVAIAILTAYWIASAQFFLLAVLSGVAVAAFVTVGLQRNAWILIAFAWCFRGEIHALPVPLETRDIVVLLVTFAYVAQRVVGQVTRRSKGVLGAIVFINFFYFAFTFVLHPVGFHALGATTMGGRPYFSAFIGLCAYWVLVHMPESYNGVARIPVWLLAGMTFSTAVAAIVYIAPSLTPYVWYFYSEVDTSGYLQEIYNPAETGVSEIHRLGTFGPFGLMLIQFMAAYFPPSKFLNPARWQFYLIALGALAILASGFRNTLAWALASIALAAWFYRGWREVIIGGLLGAVLLGFLCYGQGRFFDLPLDAQRTLGSLPGQWDDRIKSAIEISNARYQWWNQLFQQGLVKNWWFGDGFGVSETDYNLIAGGTVGFYEAAEVTGSLHNGLMTTIRYAGLVGLVVFYSLMIATAAYAVKLVARCRGTPLFPAAVFLAVDVCWRPVHFTFFFGGYNTALPEQVFLAGLLTVLWHMSERQPLPTARTASARPLSPTNRATQYM